MPVYLNKKYDIETGIQYVTVGLKFTDDKQEQIGVVDSLPATVFFAMVDRLKEADAAPCMHIDQGDINGSTTETK